MAAISGQGEFGIRFARALGLDSEKIKNIDLHVHADDAVMATIEMYVYKEDFERVELVLRDYELHLKEEKKK